MDKFWPLTMGLKYYWVATVCYGISTFWFHPYKLTRARFPLLSCTWKPGVSWSCFSCTFRFLKLKMDVLLFMIGVTGYYGCKAYF